MRKTQEEEQRITEILENKLRNYPPILSSYCQNLIDDGKSYRTIRAYTQVLLQFVNFRFGDNVPFDFYTKVSTNDIEVFLGSVRTKVRNGTPSNAAKALNWSVLNSFFQYLVPTHLNSNPLATIERPSIDKTVEMVYLSPSETLHMFDNVRQLATPRMKNRDLSILMLGFYGGLNSAAIVQANLEDIDWTRNKILLHGRNETTAIPLGKIVMEQLRVWLEDRNHYFCLADTNALFVSQECHRISGRTLADLIDKYAVGISKHVTTQVMRNTCVINLYKETGDIRLCSQYLNHSNISTTQRYIEQLTSGDDIDDAANIIEKVFDTCQLPSQDKSKTTLHLSQKERCLILRQVRKEIAESNGIVYLSTACAPTENCTSNCPIVDAEIRYLDAEIQRMIKQGRIFSLTGLNLSCFSNNEPNAGDQSQSREKDLDNIATATTACNAPKLAMEIDEIDLGTHAYTFLKQLGVVTVKDLVELPNESLLQLQRWKKVYLEIKDKLQLMGLGFIHSETQKFDSDSKSNGPTYSSFPPKRARINSVEELIHKSEEERIQAQNLGKKSLEEAQEKLKEIALLLKD